MRKLNVNLDNANIFNRHTFQTDPHYRSEIGGNYDDNNACLYWRCEEISEKNLFLSKSWIVQNERKLILGLWMNKFNTLTNYESFNAHIFKSRSKSKSRFGRNVGGLRTPILRKGKTLYYFYLTEAGESTFLQLVAMVTTP